MVGFEDLVSNKKLLLAISEMGWKEPTPIQSESVPLGLDGRDILGRAQTGSGKTGAYGIVVLGRTRSGSKKPSVLVVVPTRELAAQVSGELHRLSKRTHHEIASIYGGASIEGQVRRLEQGCDIVVGTPGRVLDLHRRGALDLSCVKELVLDEADRMLDMGFTEEVTSIISLTPPGRHVLMYSATLSEEIAGMAADHMRDPVSVAISEDTIPETMCQYYVVTERKDKIHRLNEILSTNRKCIVFCSTRKMVEELYRRLSEQGMKVGAIHGEMPQKRRDATVRGFKKGSMPTLVATDVAARGMDIHDVEIVVNYDSPYDAEDYVHRIGRTGRAGRDGIAITFVTPSEDRRIPSYTDYTGMPIARLQKDRIAETIGIAEIPDAPKAASPRKDAPRRNDPVTLMISLGKDDGVDRNSLAAIVSDAAGIPRDSVGHIGLSKRTSFVEVERGDAESVIKRLRKMKFNGRGIEADYAPKKG